MTKNIKQALQVLTALGFPRAQLNERSALCLLALLDLTHDKSWTHASAPLMGITPIMDWARVNYKKRYAPNTRETFRRQTMHQFVDAGVAIYNPDDPARPVNSPHAVYQIEKEALTLLRTFGSTEWKKNLLAYLSKRPTLAEKNAKRRPLQLIPVEIAPDREIKLSPGEHSELIKAVIESFAPRFAPGCALVYVGDTGDKWGYFDNELLNGLGVAVDSHGKMPDAVLFYPRLLQNPCGAGVPPAVIAQYVVIAGGTPAPLSNCTGFCKSLIRQRIGCFSSNPSPVTVPWTLSGTENWRNYLPLPRPDWSMSQLFPAVRSWPDIWGRSRGSRRYGWRTHRRT